MRVLLICQLASLAAVPVVRLLAKAYKLKNLTMGPGSAPSDPKEFVRFLKGDTFTDQSVILRNFSPEDGMLDAIREIDCRVIVVTRNPYDAWLSMFQMARNNSKIFSGTPLESLSSKNISDREIFEFIKNHYQSYVKVPQEWLTREPEAIKIRYEDLVRDPYRVFQSLVDNLELVGESFIQQAVREVFSCMDVINIEKNNSFDVNSYDASCLLSSKHIAAINASCGDLMTDLEYERLPDDKVRLGSRKLSQYARFQLHVGEMPRFLLTGFGKSGTTWLYMMFFRHPQTLAVSERKLIETPDQNQALLKPFLEDSFFMDWFKSSSFGIVNPWSTDTRFEMSRLISDYLLFLHIKKQSLNWRNTKREVTHLGEKIAFNKAEDARILLENMDQIYPGIEVVHIVRDPRDVAISALYHRNRNALNRNQKNWITDFIESVKKEGPEKCKKNKYFYNHIEHMASEWNQSMLYFEKFQKKYGKLHVIRYEDLVKKTSENISKLFESLGLCNEDKVVSEVIDRTSFEQLSGGRKAGQEDTESFYRKGVAGDWQYHLSTDDNEIFKRHAREFMSYYFYT